MNGIDATVNDAIGSATIGGDTGWIMKPRSLLAVLSRGPVLRLCLGLRDHGHGMLQLAYRPLQLLYTLIRAEMPVSLLGWASLLASVGALGKASTLLPPPRL